MRDIKDVIYELEYLVRTQKELDINKAIKLITTALIIASTKERNNAKTNRT